MAKMGVTLPILPGQSWTIHFHLFGFSFLPLFTLFLVQVICHMITLDMQRRKCSYSCHYECSCSSVPMVIVIFSNQTKRKFLIYLFGGHTLQLKAYSFFCAQGSNLGQQHSRQVPTHCSLSPAPIRKHLKSKTQLLLFSL